ncbi:hypothetical protein [Micavibrio aeruginosavorus]|uniref:hypothetical protein n=1 Tax=Micavibrio aeruginosavorus TaxID=349221 RepID=UPI003F4AD631
MIHTGIRIGLLTAALMAATSFGALAPMAMAADDGFGGYFTASGPQALSDPTSSMPALAAADGDDAAAALNAIAPAAGGDAPDGAAAVGETPSANTGDTLSDPATAIVPGMEANPTPVQGAILP